MGYAEEKYLACKKVVDDESLNFKVMNSLEDRLRLLGSGLQVLEIGSGIGSMLERLIERDILPSEVSYTAVEIDEKKVEIGEMRLKEFAKNNGYDICKNGDKLKLDKKEKNIIIDFQNADAFDFIQNQSKNYDLLIAHAFLDLVDIDDALPLLFSKLKSDALFYFPITFDGVTTFRPQVDPVLDRKIERIYHESMAQRDQGYLMGGNSKTGRQLFDHLNNKKSKIISAGSSDWVIYPGENGYSEGVPYFLHYIVNLVKNSVENSDKIPVEKLERWADIRHRQIENEELFYIAHQLDIFGKV